MAMENYQALLTDIMRNGDEVTSRQGTHRGIYNKTLEYNNISENFPLLTLRKLNFNNITAELQWILEGSTNIKRLHQLGSCIWDNWADEKGSVGPVYGYQLRHFDGIDLELNDHYGPSDDYLYTYGTDQLKMLMKSITMHPNSKRHILTLWNPKNLVMKHMPSCTTTMQVIIVSQKNKMHLIVNMRSSDAILGLPQDIATHALFLHWLSNAFNYKPGTLYMNLGHVHVYNYNYLHAIEIIGRCQKPLPRLLLDRKLWKELESSCDDIPPLQLTWLYSIDNYNPHPYMEVRKEKVQ